MMRDCGGGYCFFLPTPTHRQVMVADDGIMHVYISRHSSCKHMVLAGFTGKEELTIDTD